MIFSMLFVFSMLFAMAPGCDYSFIHRAHTVCTFAPRECPGSQLIRSGINHQDQGLILTVHNRLRSIVASGQHRGLPPAANMKELTWDPELAAIAQLWADQCRDGHDTNRDVTRFEVGQNVAVVWNFDQEDLLGDDPDWETQIRAWFDEYQAFGFSPNDINPFRFKQQTGHFTQLVWADTYTIGCGYSYYLHPQKGFTKIYVCNYGPGGNVIGDPMYELSPQPICTSSSPSRSYTGLCDASHSYLKK